MKEYCGIGPNSLTQLNHVLSIFSPKTLPDIYENMPGQSQCCIKIMRLHKTAIDF
jgi:hypothetical protein